MQPESAETISAPGEADRPAETVDRVRDLPYEDFVRDYLVPLKPVVVEDALKDWPAIGKWTPRFFKERYAHREIEIDGKSYRVADFIDLVEQSVESKATFTPYFRNESVHKYFADIASDIEPLPKYVEPNWLQSKLFPKSWRKKNLVELFIGGLGSSFPVLHYDAYHVHAYLFEIYGDKEYIIFPPEDTPYLYPKKNDRGTANLSSVENLEAPDLERFPLYAKATMTKCVLRPGEMLFCPSAWWHTAKALNPSITVAVNTANFSNWREVRADYTNRCKDKPPIAAAISAYFAMIGMVEGLRAGPPRPMRKAS